MSMTPCPLIPSRLKLSTIAIIHIARTEDLKTEGLHSEDIGIPEIQNTFHFIIFYPLTVH